MNECDQKIEVGNLILVTCDFEVTSRNNRKHDLCGQPIDVNERALDGL
jgi:hypothetical protein